MAKGQMRSNKEAKKPKKEKAVATTAVHPLAAKIMENQAKPKKGKCSPGRRVPGADAPGTRERLSGRRPRWGSSRSPPPARPIP